MTLTIGRVGSDIALSDHHEFDERGDGTVSLSVWSDASTTTDASFLRDQLLGLAHRVGEAFVPVTFGTDSDRDGWYQVLDVAVSDVLGLTERDGDRVAKLRLRRLPYRTAPRYEIQRAGTVWTNSHSITESTYKGFVAVPLSAAAVDLGLTTTVTRGSRATETGSLAFYTTSDDTYDTVVSAYVPMADAYDGAAKIEVDVTGSGDWRTVVGGDIPHLPTRWRIGNGITRAVWDTTAHALEVEVYDTSTWVNLGEASGPASNYFKISDAAASYITTDPVAVDVLHNSPLLCILRCVFDFDTAKDRVFLDLAVRRGDRNVIGVLKSRSTNQWGIEPTQTGATTAITGAVRIDSNDNQGNRWVASCPKTVNLNTSTGAWRLSSADQVLPFAIGTELNGSSATSQNTAQNIAYQFYAQANERLFIARN